MSKFLNTIVQRLTKEEIRFFKLFLNRTNAKNRKDVDLFDLMRKKRDVLNLNILLVSQEKLRTFGSFVSIKDFPRFHKVP